MISSTYKKKHQRKMNQVVRKMNKNIEEDSLWQGRFYMRQTGAQWVPYLDGSGCGELWVTLKCIDKKTGKSYSRTETVNHWTIFHGYKVFDFMNWFIIEYIDYWRTERNERSFLAWNTYSSYDA